MVTIKYCFAVGLIAMPFDRVVVIDADNAAALQCVTLELADDDLVEGLETISLLLMALADDERITISPSQSSVMVEDNDGKLAGSLYHFIPK